MAVFVHLEDAGPRSCSGSFAKFAAMRRASSLGSRFAPRWPNRHKPGNKSWGRVKLRHRRHKKEPQAVYALGALLSLLPRFRLLSWAAGCRGMGAAQPGLMNGI